MINHKKFEEKVKSMPAHDIIMAMIEGLRNPKTKIDMHTFGEMRNGVCFGCAATNAILHIMDANEDEVKSYVAYRQKYYNSPLRDFEYAIDILRQGRWAAYNAYGFAQITRIPGQNLPFLGDDYTEEQLKEYEKLAKHQLMINYEELVRKIKSMSAHDIIMSMVNGLRNPKTRINMDTYGYMKEDICFGCAATNAILHIMEANEEEVKSYVTYSTIFDDSPLWIFEYAIDKLRLGQVEVYNKYVAPLGFAQIIPISGQYLPDLDNDYTEEQLQEYVKLAEHQLVTKNQ